MDEFRLLYQMYPSTFFYICDLVEADLAGQSTNFGPLVPVEVKVAVSLKILNQGST